MVVIAVFQTIFAVGQPLSNLMQSGLDVTGARLGNLLPDGYLRSLLINGVWKGTGSVLVFLPQILLLFLVIGILEDSGYLARAAIIADKTMSRVGLNGKSFIPLLSAYACAVPAIMATRTIESKRDRIATILIAPFMTCSARLPVYTMVIAAFLPNRPLLGPLLGTRAVAMLGLYVLGFLMAVATAKLLNSTVLRSKDTPFVLEMPPYRWPRPVSLGLRLVDRGKAFLYRAGTVIMLVSLLLWAATNFPMHNGKPPAVQDSVVALSVIASSRHPAADLIGRLWDADLDRCSRSYHFDLALHGVDPDLTRRSASRATRRTPSSRGVTRLLRLCHAMHVDHRRSASRNQRLEVAHHPVHVHDAGGLRLRLRGVPHCRTAYRVGVGRADLQVRVRVHKRILAIHLLPRRRWIANQKAAWLERGAEPRALPNQSFRSTSAEFFDPNPMQLQTAFPTDALRPTSGT